MNAEDAFVVATAAAGLALRMQTLCPEVAREQTDHAVAKLEELILALREQAEADLTCARLC